MSTFLVPLLAMSTALVKTPDGAVDPPLPRKRKTSRRRRKSFVTPARTRCWTHAPAPPESHARWVTYNDTCLFVCLLQTISD